MEDMENVIVLENENGEKTEYEIVTDLHVDENIYYVLYPMNSEDEDAIVLRLDEDENGEYVFAEIEDDDEFDKVAQAYDEWLEEDEE